MDNAKQSFLRRALGALKKYPVTVLFTVFVVGMMAADALAPDRAMSELENKMLQQRPAFSITPADLANGGAAKKLNTFFTQYQEYVKEQVFARDAWINLQSRCELLAFQKLDYGGILMGRDSMEFTRTWGLLGMEETYLPKNTAAVEALGQRYPGRVNLMVVPSASNIYSENVPADAPLLDENAYIDGIYAQTPSVRAVDVRQTLASHSGEYIFYRTDHHWTSDGAYYAYDALCGALGLTPFDRAAHTAETVPDFYGTSYAKCRQWNAKPDTITYYDLPSTLTVYQVSAADSFAPQSETGLYNTEKFASYDKYGAFLYGNNGLSRLSGTGSGSILVIKDSYANCFVPYLTENYANVDVVDLRFYNYGLDGLIGENNYDQILVLYSFASFKADTKLSVLGLAG